MPDAFARSTGSRAPYFPTEFLRKFEQLLGDDFPAFYEKCHEKLRETVRVNTLKTTVAEGRKALEHYGFSLEKVPFTEDSFYAGGENLRFEPLPQFRDGLIHVQEASSLLPAIVLDPHPNETILDMAAAPGGKTTQMAALMENAGAIQAVEINRLRIKSLRYNLNRLGVVNTVLVMGDASALQYPVKFDRVLLDAPCSSEGLVRKHVNALRDWSPALVNEKAALQKRLVAAAFDALKEGGVMVYSTCSLSPEENEYVVQHLLETTGNAELEEVKVNGFKLRPGFADSHGQLKKCARVLPQDNDSQAFFVAKIRRRM